MKPRIVAVVDCLESGPSRLLLSPHFPHSLSTFPIRKILGIFPNKSCIFLFFCQSADCSVRKHSRDLPSCWAEKTCSCKVRFVQVPRQRGSPRVLWGFIWGCLGNKEKQKIILIRGTAELGKTRSIWEPGHSAASYGLSHYRLPRLCSWFAMVPLPCRFGWFMASAHCLFSFFLFLQKRFL